MSYIEKLKTLNIDNDAVITQTLKEFAEVFITMRQN